jgi:hypothetical protein
MGEPEEDAPSVEPSEAVGASPDSDAKRNNDSTIALSEQEFQALQVPSAPPAIPTPRPAPAPVSRNDASMWAGSVLVADEFEPLEVPKNPMGRWVLLAFFGLGVVGAALYFLWWRPAQDVDAAESVAAKAAEPAPVAAPAPAPAAEPAPAAQATPPPEAQPAVAAPEKPAAAPAPKKTASKKKSSAKKKSSSKKKTSSKKKKTSKKKSHHGG